MIGSGAFGEVWLAEAEGILTLEPRDKTSIAAKRRSKIRRSQRYTHLHIKEKKKGALPESTGEKTLVAVKTLKGLSFSKGYCVLYFAGFSVAMFPPCICQVSLGYALEHCHACLFDSEI